MKKADQQALRDKAKMNDTFWEEMEEKYGDKDLKSLARSFKSVHKKLDAQKAKASLLQKEFDYIRLKALVDKMEEAGLTIAKVEGVGRVQLAGDLYASAEDKDMLMTWLKDNGHEGLIQDTINSSTLKAFIKDQIKQGIALPKDTFRVLPFTRASVVKAGK